MALELGADVVGADADPRAGRLEKNADAKKAASAANAGVVVRTDLGAHENFAASFAEADIIVLSPGVALTQPQVAAALARGEQEVLSELAFAARSVYATERDFFAAEKGAAPTKKLAVTGTNGKSTTCAFAAQLVRACGKRAFVGGNLGTPLSLCALEFLRAAAAGAEAPPYDALVIEISSYQLEHPGWRSLRFDAACVTTLSPDHLERHGDMATYAAVKARVFAALRGAKKLAVVPVAEDVAFETEDGEDDVVALARRDAVVDAMTTDSVESQTETFEHVGGDVARVGDLPGVVVDHTNRRATIRLPFAKPETLDLSALRAAGAHNATNAGVAALLVRGLDADAFPLRSLEAGIAALEAPPHRMRASPGRATTRTTSSGSTTARRPTSSRRAPGSRGTRAAANPSCSSAGRPREAWTVLAGSASVCWRMRSRNTRGTSSSAPRGKTSPRSSPRRAQRRRWRWRGRCATPSPPRGRWCVTAARSCSRPGARRSTSSRTSNTGDACSRRSRGGKRACSEGLKVEGTERQVKTTLAVKKKKRRARAPDARFFPPKGRLAPPRPLALPIAFVPNAVCNSIRSERVGIFPVREPDRRTR